jgi:hypothetical protein
VIYAEHGDIAAEIIAKFHKTNGRYLEVLAHNLKIWIKSSYTELPLPTI